MWNSYAKLPRLKKALEYSKLDPEKMSIRDLFRTLDRRGITDAILNGIAWSLISVLEPPSCRKTHCEHYGGQSAFCDCGLGRIPGRCKEHREYLQRCEERKAIWIDRAMSEALCHLSEEDVRSADWGKFWDWNRRDTPEVAVQKEIRKMKEPRVKHEITALAALADIRAALGVGDKPMLSELPGIVRARMDMLVQSIRKAPGYPSLEEMEILAGYEDKEESNG